MVQKGRKNISIYDDTYETLRHMGSVTESFDSVVRKLIEKAASSQQPLDGSGGQTAAAPPIPRSGGQNG